MAVCGLDDQGQLRGWGNQIHCVLGIRVLRSVDNVCPFDQFLQVVGFKAEFFLGHRRNIFRARLEGRIIHLATRGVVPKMFGVFW